MSDPYTKHGLKIMALGTLLHIMLISYHLFALSVFSVLHAVTLVY